MSARATSPLGGAAQAGSGRRAFVRTLARHLRPPSTESLSPGTVLVGRDMAGGVRTRGQRHSRLLGGVLVGGVLAALLLSAVRTEIFHLRYQLSDAQSREHRLDETRRALTVEMRGLRDPMRLRRLAAERGFVRPEQVIELRGKPAGARLGAP